MDNPFLLVIYPGQKPKQMAKKKWKPESLMTPHLKNPEWYEKTIKEPIFQTSTYGFNSAEEGEQFFKRVYGGKELNSGNKTRLIYSRFSFPNLISLESKFPLLDNGEDSAFFNTGMAAISTMFMALLKPGDLILKSEPMYGGSDHFIKDFLKKWGVDYLSFNPDHTQTQILSRIRKRSKTGIALGYIETPCNPTNDLIDIEMVSKVCKALSSKKRQIPLVVDNTFLGPIGQKPLDQGADLSVYSASKYIGGHGDLVAGAVSGKEGLVSKVKALRYSLGNMAEPNTAWMLNRSLETLTLRMQKQFSNAEAIAGFLKRSKAIKSIKYPGLSGELSKKEKVIYNKQCLGPGAMIGFEVNGGKEKAFKFLNNLELIRLAVSLGGTESNAQHPWTMSHSNVPIKDRKKWGISPSFIRLSVGVENAEDLVQDLQNSLKKSGIA